MKMWLKHWTDSTLRVLMLPHVEHYTIGLSRELTKYVDLTLLSSKRFDTPSKQVILPSIPRVTGLLKRLYYKTYSYYYHIFHANTAIGGSTIGALDKLVITEHGWPDPGLVHDLYRDYYVKEYNALLYLHGHGVPIVTISNYSAEMLRKRCGVKVRAVIYHGLLEEFMDGVRELPEKLIILWVSRLIKIKEPLILLKALAKLSKEIDFKAYIVGDGPLRDAMTRFLNERKELTGKVSFLGKLPFKMMPRLYKIASILVHTASFEAFGLAVLEAMGAGLPVIVPRSGGAYEIAGADAISFSPHDPEDLANKIASLCSDRRLYEKQSKRSLERAKEFSWEKAAKSYLKIYESIV